MNPAFALAEVIWILTGRSDATFLTYWNKRLSSFVGDDPNLYGAYGARLRSVNGLDQLERAYTALKNNASSRQVVLQIWSPVLDLPEPNGRPRSRDIPCNISSCLKVRNGRLHWLQTLRSNDIFLGLPHNIVQFTMLQEVFAGWLGIVPGEYVHVSDSLHMYGRDTTVMSIDTEVIPAPNTDRFVDSFSKSMQCFNELAKLTDVLREPRVNVFDLIKESRALPEPYSNIFTVFVSEYIRRTGEKVSAITLMDECTNPVYRQLWNRWAERQRVRS